MNRIVWNNSSSHDVVADGVEIKPVDGTVRVLKAKREVILSAGSQISCGSGTLWSGKPNVSLALK